MDEGRPQTVDLGTEQEILISRLERQVERAWHMRDEPLPEELAGLSWLAVGAVLRGLRVMSGRQLAVLLAEHPSRGTVYVIHEPPRYTAAEISEHA